MPESGSQEDGESTGRSRTEKGMVAFGERAEQKKGERSRKVRGERAGRGQIGKSRCGKALRVSKSLLSAEPAVRIIG